MTSPFDPSNPSADRSPTEPVPAFPPVQPGPPPGTPIYAPVMPEPGPIPAPVRPSRLSVRAS